jgi:tetraacyldisaccharide 4'-kinase
VALAEALAKAGKRVAFVGHGYRGHLRAARAVKPTDVVAEVGDDALFAARHLSPLGVDVVVGPSRQAAIDRAARDAPWLVVDGLLQARPEPLACSILALDSLRPWGRGRCPPSGDLRARADVLLGAADGTLMVHDAASEPRAEDPPHRVCWQAESHLPFATHASGCPVALSELATSRIGLLLTIARPGRVVDALARRGIFPLRLICFGDHDCPSLAALEHAVRRRAPPVEVWLTTAKCALKLPSSIHGAPVLALRHALELPPELVGWVLSRDRS